MDMADDDTATPAPMDVPAEGIQISQAMHEGNY
jgi:hypothetical protein